ncbi:MAG: 2OG-Fe(II) oxygenase family protein, partial [Methylophilus sp.]|nr:2OG-Fe(II) oxygenase family protein [Methylophilus sp.]
GLDFVYHRAIPELAENSALLQRLLHDIHHADIAERKQARLTNGKQSAGNLFKRPEASFKALSELIKRAFVDYRNYYGNKDCALITHFPETLEFTSSWYVKMQQGGHLNAHIHEIGWISGAVYLAMPESTDPREGAFEYGTHGDEYPQLHTDFPTAYVKPKVGDIVLFPSSLFHRTIPFNAQQERICIAFDLKPQGDYLKLRTSY